MNRFILVLLLATTAWACNTTRTVTTTTTTTTTTLSPAQEVLNDYVEAIGGRAKLEAVTDLTTILTGNVQGQVMEQSFYQSGGNKFSSQTNMMGMTLADQRYNDGATKMVQQGVSMPVDEAMKQGMAEQARFFPELQAFNDASNYSLEGNETVDGVATVVVKKAAGEGNAQLDYFSQETGLKIQTVIMTPAGNQTIKVSDYREVAGIMFPHHMDLVGFAPFPISMDVKEIKVNEPIDQSLFEVD